MVGLRAVFGDLAIDSDAWEVRLRGARVELTPTEFQILLVLAAHRGQVVAGDALVRSVWGDGWFGDDNNLAVHVSKLRRKLGESGVRQRYIRTIRGVGYRFDPGNEREEHPSRVLRACDDLARHPHAVQVSTDGLLRVVSVRPAHARVLGFESRDLLGKYFPVVHRHPWLDHGSALEGVGTLISSGIREWRARHVVQRADGTSVQADLATCIDVDEGGCLAQLRFVIVELDSSSGGGGDW